MTFFSKVARARRCVGLAVVVAAFAPLAAIAQQSAYMSPPSVQPQLSQAGLAEAIVQARPMEQRLGATEGMTSSLATTAAMATQSDGLPLFTQGHSGVTVQSLVDEAFYRSLAETMGTDAQSQPAADAQASTEIAPQNYGREQLNSIYHYNDYLQVPVSNFYPQRSIGKLFFMASDGYWYSCTATLVNFAILLTAGHCVYEGGTGDATGWNQDGYFVPAFSVNGGGQHPLSGGTFRFGYCRVSQWATTPDWYNIGDLNGGYDVGLGLCGRLEGASVDRFNDRFPGGRLGYLSMCYRNCRQSHWFMTQFGYPSNYYNGGEMTVSQHLEVTGQEIPPLPSNWYGIDYIYGSGMRGGSSGGPHISNVGEILDSASPGEYTDRNVVFAVTSWGYTSDIWKIQGASPLTGYNNDNGFVEAFNRMCRRSRQTYGRWTCPEILVP